MGYALEFYNLDWERLRRVFGCGDRQLLEDILTKEGESISAGPDAQTAWLEALRNLILGPRGAAIAAQERNSSTIYASSTEALAVVAIVRFLGDRRGEIMHTTRGGGKFRELFEPAMSNALFRTSLDLRLLLSRPLLGLELDGYPFWGGLSALEISSGLADLPPEPVYSDAGNDPDYEQWAFELHRALLDAKDTKQDLVTLYL
jgi:hypothetical protein